MTRFEISPEMRFLWASNLHFGWRKKEIKKKFNKKFGNKKIHSPRSVTAVEGATNQTKHLSRSNYWVPLSLNFHIKCTTIVYIQLNIKIMKLWIIWKKKKISTWSLLGDRHRSFSEVKSQLLGLAHLGERGTLM